VMVAGLLMRAFNPSHTRARSLFGSRVYQFVKYLFLGSSHTLSIGLKSGEYAGRNLGSIWYQLREAAWCQEALSTIKSTFSELTPVFLPKYHEISERHGYQYMERQVPQILQTGAAQPQLLTDVSDTHFIYFWF
jgi:hypothetical protein